MSREKGLKAALDWRDGPFRDYRGKAVVFAGRTREELCWGDGKASGLRESVRDGGATVSVPRPKN